MKTVLPFLCIALLAALVGCDQDPFHKRERLVLSGFELEKWEDGKTFYLVREGYKDDGGGVLDGPVIRIGWNNRYILAERKANFGGDKDGWMIVDTITKQVSGPFSDAELRSRPEVDRVPVITASDAWQRLH